MKVINEYGCYIQVNDILYLYRVDRCFPNGLMQYIIYKYGNDIDMNSYVKIENLKYKKYIETTRFLFDYNYLKTKTNEELNEIISEIIRESYLKLEVTNNYITEKENRRYLISQIKEVQNDKNALVKRFTNIQKA